MKSLTEGPAGGGTASGMRQLVITTLLVAAAIFIMGLTVANVLP